ncbi:unnamed protein product [Brassica oleracea]
MKDADTLPLSTSSAAASTGNAKKENGYSALFAKGRYKFWALAAILLLAFWSMLTGTVNLRWSAGNISHFTDDLVFPIHEDLDVLEMEEREKVVKHMWDVYNNGRRIRLPRFWQEAFEAAYEELTSDVPDVVEAAISEIARMSIRSVVIDPPPVHSTVRVSNTESDFNGQRTGIDKDSETCGQRKNDSNIQTKQPSIEVGFFVCFIIRRSFIKDANNMITSEFLIPNETLELIKCLTPNLLKLFEPQAPLEFQPPPVQGKCPPYTGMAQYVSHFAEPGDPEYAPPKPDVETPAQKRARIHKSRLEKGVEKAAEDLKNYDPNNDANASGDPYKTLFVARLNYETSDSKIKREFEAYGPIKQVSCGVLLAAYKQGDGKKIDGRRVPVDVERGRTVPNWRPRRLGSGLGTTRVPGEKITGEEEQKQQQPSQGRSSRSEEPRAREDREKSRDRGKEREREQSRERSHERSRDRPRESHREDKHHRDRGRERESRRAEEIETVVHGITIVTGVGKGKGSTRAASMTTMVGDLVREKRSMRGEVTQTVMISRATVTDMMIVSTSGQSVLSRMSMVLMADAIVFP